MSILVSMLDQIPLFYQYLISLSSRWQHCITLCCYSNGTQDWIYFRENTEWIQ